MKQIILPFFFLLISLLTFGQQDPFVEMWSEKQIDSLKNEWKNSHTNDTVRMKLARSLSWHYQESNRDSSLYYQAFQLDLAKKLKLKLWEADAYDSGGWLLGQVKNYPLSLQYFISALDILQDQGCEQNIWSISVFSRDQDPRKARLTCLSSTYNDLATLYTNTGNRDKESFYLSLALKTAQSINNSTMIALITLNAGGAYLRKGQPDSALVFIKTSQEHIKKSGYKTYEGENLRNLGDLYLHKKEYPLAKQYYSESIASSMANNNKTGKSLGLYALANYFNVLHKTDSACYYVHRAIDEFNSLNNYKGLSQAYYFLHELYKKTNDADSAYHYLQLYTYLSDAYNKSERDKIDAYQNVGFNQQIEMKEREKKQIEKENTIRTYAMIAGIGVLILIASLLYINNQNRKKANQLLQKQKLEIEIQKSNVEKTLGDLKSTQAQLIQSEKMASLGELTAGIAHEIQNPLNFVNNFSELNRELVSDLNEEINKGNIEDVKAIANDIKQNSEKINHHGLRASSIVKGMLEHSRTSSGTKEPTDINSLCEEYVKLSYQAMRAKDPMFTAEYKLDFDPDLPKVNVVAQDISRVILNLVNNGLYACNERKLSVEERKQILNQKSNNDNHSSNNEHELGSPIGVRGKSTNVNDISILPTATSEGTIGEGEKTNDYKPLVKVSTKNLGNKIEISIKDNGPGIPDNIKDKIFQPFFTTKPTGQGTGLGLSLAYDIVRAHGGTLEVVSTEGVGTEFIITLPFTTNG